MYRCTDVVGSGGGGGGVVYRYTDAGGVACQWMGWGLIGSVCRGDHGGQAA